MAGRLEGKVAVVTGAGSGMGAAMVRRFCAEGAKVIAADISGAEEETARGEGAAAVACRVDVSRAREVKAMLDLAVERFGRLDILCNNAGIQGPLAATADYDEDEWDKVIAVNQTATFLGIKAVIPSMLKAGGGSIVNVSSISGIVAIYGTPNVAYAASKFAVRGITKQVAIEYGGDNIRCNSVHPGYIRTPMMTAALNDEQIKIASGSVPIKRVGEPVDVAKMIVYLASDESGFVTGAEHIIDGGLTAL